MARKEEDAGFDPEIAGKGEMDDDVLPEGEPQEQSGALALDGDRGRGAERVPDEGLRAARALRAGERRGEGD